MRKFFAFAFIFIIPILVIEVSSQNTKRYLEMLQVQWENFTKGTEFYGDVVEVIEEKNGKESVHITKKSKYLLSSNGRYSFVEEIERNNQHKSRKEMFFSDQEKNILCVYYNDGWKLSGKSLAGPSGIISITEMGNLLPNIVSIHKIDNDLYCKYKNNRDILFSTGELIFHCDDMGNIRSVIQIQYLKDGNNQKIKERKYFLKIEETSKEKVETSINKYRITSGNMKVDKMNF